MYPIIYAATYALYGALVAISTIVGACYAIYIFGSFGVECYCALRKWAQRLRFHYCMFRAVGHSKWAAIYRTSGLRWSGLFWLVYVAVALLALGACTPMPTAPSTPRGEPAVQPQAGPAQAPLQAPVQDPMLHHGVLAVNLQGEVMYVCATQVRSYTLPDGMVHAEVDHYLQYSACPVVPID